MLGLKRKWCEIIVCFDYYFVMNNWHVRLLVLIDGDYEARIRQISCVSVSDTRSDTDTYQTRLDTCPGRICIFRDFKINKIIPIRFWYGPNTSNPNLPSVSKNRLRVCVVANPPNLRRLFLTLASHPQHSSAVPVDGLRWRRHARLRLHLRRRHTAQHHHHRRPSQLPGFPIDRHRQRVVLGPRVGLRLQLLCQHNTITAMLCGSVILQCSSYFF